MSVSSVIIVTSEKLAKIEEAGKYAKAFLERDNLCKRICELEEQQLKQAQSS